MESFFQHVGACGCFQICHVLCVQMIRMVNAWCLSLMTFGNYEPPWECLTYSNSTVNISSSMSLDTDQRGWNHSESLRVISSQQSDSTAYNDTSLHFRQGTCDQLPLCDEIRFDPTSVTLVTEFGLICGQAYIPSLIIAVQMCGMVVGTTLGGQTAELFGRKISIYSSLAVMSASTLVASWSNSWQMYAIFIFFVGVGCGGIVSSHTLYVMEFLTPAWRGRFAAFPSWNISLLTFAIFAVVLKNWRHIHLVFGVVSALCLFAVLFSPESLRWLRVHGKDAQARKVITKIMKFNGRKENVDEVFDKFKEISVDEESGSRKYTYLDLFRSKKIRTLTIKSSIAFFFVVMCYFTLGFSVKALSGDFYTNLFLSSLLEMPFLLIVGFCINRLGRKITTSFFVCSGTAFTMACVIAYYVTSSVISGPIITYLALISKGFFNMGWITVCIFGVELFPTVVRSLAVGYLNTVGIVGSTLGAVLIPRDQNSLVVCFIVLSGGMLFSCLIILSLPETNNKPLEDDLKPKTNLEEKEEDDVSI